MSKLERLRNNVAAIECALKGENNAEVLGKYTGFGGLGFILNPKDEKYWNKTDMQFRTDTIRLHEMLCEYAKDSAERGLWLQSLKQSTLTAFYTPKEIVRAIEKAFADFDFDYMLDPASGNGVFMRLGGISKKSVAYEKDLLTGLLLKSGMYGHWENVEVRVDGFETIPANELGTYDLVSTNVPFGDISVYDPAYTKSDNTVRREAAKMIHRYYVLKGLDCLRDGGIEAYIITSNYLNNDSDQLQEALKQARLIGAYRLANNLFKGNGTEVGTDLLVLQKDVNKQELTSDECMLLTAVEEEGCPTNMYFSMYPDHVIATGKEAGTDAYGKPGLVYSHKDGVKGIAGQLGKVLAEDMKEKTLPLPLSASEGSDYQKPDEKKTEKRTTRKEKVLMEIMEAYRHLEQYEREEQTEQAETRSTLNAYYDGWVNEYGHFHDAKNRKDVERVNKELLALEMKDADGKWQKSDIFFKPVAFSTEERREMTAHDALSASLNKYGGVKLGYMSELTGREQGDLLDELRSEVFYNPISNDYEIKAKFVSGNVIEKIEKIEAYEKKMKGTYSYDEDSLLCKQLNESLEALRAAVPTPIAFADLDFNLGERWVDAGIYQRFACDFFSMPDDRASVTVKYVPTLDQYVVASSSWNERIRTQFSVTSETGNKVDGVDLLTHALHNTMPKLLKYKRNEYGRILTKVNSKGDTEYVKEEDEEAIGLANDKINQIRDGYTEWLQQQPKAVRDALAAEYNRKFNCFVKPEYDGSHQTFPGLDRKAIAEKYGVKDLYKSQKDCIWMLLLNGGGICDHEVGSGKTLIMCIAAHEMKRLGMCHKPMIIGLKANVSAIAETYRTCYPEARVLFATEADYTKSNRVDFFNRMKTGDWDVVIMSHEQFGMIPQPLRIQQQITCDMLQQVEDALKAISDSEGWAITKKMQRGLEKRKANLNTRLAALKADIAARKDDVSDFEQLGVDHIFVDESHQFKNLGFVTRHDRVAGLGNVEGSQRAFNLLMAVRAIQNRTGRDLGATFLSGTTVTNSLTELYLLFHYLRPNALRKQGITCFDAWAAIFTKKSQEYEFSITNTIQLKERFRYFIKVPELAMFYNEITDYKTAKDVGIVRPESDPVLLKMEPTPDQEEYIKVLMEFAQTGNFKLIGMNHVTKQQENAKMLYATNLARKMSLDMRLIDPTYGDHPNNKVSKCAEKIYQWYKAFDEMKGTQLVFSDLSTWDSGKWNVYAAIRDKLVDEYGIPKSEIRFIQEAKNDRQKQEIIRLTNEGRVRVLFGSTSMLGTGVNAQKRVVCVHHLDTPWRPSDLEQRDGRAVRKGNEVAADWQDNKVKVIIYAVERSLDSYKFQLLHSKQVFISQLKRGQLNVRTLDEGAMDEKSGMNFAEYMAVLSGNTDLLDRAKLEKRIAALEGERKNFYRERHRQEDKLASLQQQTDAYVQNIGSAQRDWQRFEKAAERDVAGNVVNRIVIDGSAVDTDAMPVGGKEWTAAVARELMRIDNDTLLPPGQIRTVGNIYGFPVQLRTESSGGEHHHDGSVTATYRNVFSVKGEKIGHTLDNGHLNHGVLQKAAGYALDCLLAIPGRIESWQHTVKVNQTSIRQLEQILAVEWGKDDALRQMKHDLAELDKKIGASLKKADGEVKDIAAETKKELPYKFSIDRGDTVVTFKRAVASLVSIAEMKELAERLVEGLEGWGRRHWHINDGWSWHGDTRYDDDVTVEFTDGDKCQEFILTVMRWQDERVNDRAWLKAHAALSSDGTDETRNNETILAARKLLGVKKAA